MKDVLQPLVTTLEDDIRQRIGEVPELETHVAGEYRRAREVGRTGASLSTFRDQLVTQAAVAWVLAAVFVRFLEDHGLLDEAGGGKVRWIAGDSLPLVDLAGDREHQYFRLHPHHGEREYLLHVFEQVGALPGMERLFDRRHTPLWDLAPSADGARDLLALFRRRDPESGEVVLRFAAASAAAPSAQPSPPRTGERGPEGSPSARLLDTRFLGDLYQDLSEGARKRFALLQTPDFVEAFLLDRSLEPAIERWGLAEVRLIDPACGSGHFLLGAFARLLERHRHAEPAENPRVLVQRALLQVAGVDLNPFAAAIARFRLLVAALAACGIERLAAAPAFEIRVASGDSLLHGRRPATKGQAGELFTQAELGTPEAEHFFASEEAELLATIFAEPYPVVVANPPYITVKDPGLRDLYRSRFESCSGKYSLVCPFFERLFDLATADGHIAAIVGNAFMKRQFGRKVVEGILPHWDVTHIVDTSGAYIPGHGTPTLMLLARGRKPVAETIRTVMGIRGEPSTPDDPARGKVWSAIVSQIDQVGSESEWVSVEDLPRERLSKHPWSLQGGGATQLLKAIEDYSPGRLASAVTEIGFGAVLGEDEAFSSFFGSPRFQGIAPNFLRPLAIGDRVRDYNVSCAVEIIFPYSPRIDLLDEETVLNKLWPLRTALGSRKAYGNQTYVQAGRPWWEYHQIPKGRNQIPLSITFAFVATHNHFVLDRGGKVFNRTAPVIKLPAGASEDAHLELIGLLNSSTACFWMKQIFFCRGSTVDKKGARQTTVPFEDFYEHDGTKLKQFPLPEGRPLELARRLDTLAQQLQAHTPAALCARELPSRAGLDAARAEHRALRRRMIAAQEELDWCCYQLYGLADEELCADEAQESPPLELGERVFEIALARRMALGEVESRWFERHGSTPRIELPEAWPSDYRALAERRLAAIADNKALRLIERPEYKRRWSREPWQKLESQALERWLLDRLEAPELWREPRLTSTARLADQLRRDPDFVAVGALYRGHDDYDLDRLVAELVAGEGVPYLADQRYKPSGLRKRAVWEEVWALQRREDALDRRAELAEDDPRHLGREQLAEAKRALDIPVPPKYGRGDFRSATTWRLRGKLDVPKERFVLYPGAERQNDPTTVLGWAGWNPLERAQALATAYVEARDREAWPTERLVSLLEGLAELLPWLLQWHDQPDPSLGMGLGTYFQGFHDEERRRLAGRE